MEAISPSRRVKHCQSFQDSSSSIHGRDLQSQQSPRLSRRKTTPFSFQPQPVYSHETTRTAATVEWVPRIVDWGTSSTLIDDPYHDKSTPDPKNLCGINCRFCLAVYDRSQWLGDWPHWHFFYEQSTESCTALFHGECSACHPLEEDAIHDLCDFCNHLRLRHLLSCTPDSFTVQLRFPVGNIAIKDTNCLFCRMVKEALDRSGNPESSFGIVYLTRIPEELNKAFIMSDAMKHFDNIAQNGAHILACDPALGSERKQRLYSLPNLITDETWNMVKFRLEQCINDHPACAPTNPRSDVSNFRLIDVRRRCLVNASVKDEFVALSYVWGTPTINSYLRATRSSIPFLEKDGSLSSSSLPQTIEDAIRVCDRLSESHLWVDQLCIVQDDPDNIQHQIDRMASIYSSAKLVIIDSSGDSADHGLRGVSRGRRVLPKAITIHGLQFHCAPLPRWQTEPYSVWASRGWTFQESVLAVRRLFFSSNQICYECRSDTMHESKVTNVNVALLQRGRTGAISNKSWADRQSFGSLFGLYRERSLTYQSDACNAFSGIIEAAYGIENSWFGLPHPCFDESLLWHTVRSKWTSRPEQGIKYPTEDVSFPTLSWASSSGPQSMDLPISLIFCMRFCGALVSWAILSSKGIQTIRSTAPIRLSDDWREAMAIAWTNKCIESTCQLGLTDCTTLDVCHQRLVSNWPSYKEFWDDAFDVAADSPYNTKLCSDLNYTAAPGSWGEMILTRAQCAHFGLDLGIQGGSPWRKNTLSISNTKGRRVGILWRLDPRVRSEIDPFLALNVKYEFIAISVHLDSNFNNNPPWGVTHLADMDLDYTDNTLRASGGEVPLTCCVAVILIGRKGLLAHRIGIGFIHLRDWIDANPVFKDIIFE